MDLSPDDDDVKVRKMRILRKISEDIENGSVYENKLQQLEILENLLAQEGLKASESMREAYSAVARECTAKYLVCAEKKKQIYIDAVQRIWLRRFMGLFEKGSSLISPALKNCAKEVKAAMYDEQVCERLREDNTRNKALLSLKRFVTEQLTLMDQNSRDVLARHRGSDFGVSVREPVRQTVPETVHETARECGESKNLGNEYTDEKQGEDGDRFFDAEAELQKEVCNSKGDVEVNDGENGWQGTRKVPEDVEAGAKAKEKALGHKSRAHRDPSKTKASRRLARHPVKISSVEELDVHPSPVQINGDVTSEHSRVLDDLRTSKLELLDALRLKQVLTTKADKENTNTDIPNKKRDDDNTADSGTEENVEPAREAEPKKSLMDRNHTARTYEWEDSIENASEEIGSDEGRPRLRSPRRMVVSPLRKNQPTKGANRRRRVAWLPEETEALMEGVARYGRQWKKIKLAFPIILARRTEVDLKDKYRVAMKSQDAFNEASESK